MDWQLKVETIIEDFNFTCDRNKSWVDEVMFGAKGNLLLNGTFVLPRTPSLGKKLIYNNLKISDHGYESFNCSQNCANGNKSSCSIKEKHFNSVCTQTDQVIILNLGILEILLESFEKIKREALSYFGGSVNDEACHLRGGNVCSLKKNITRYISQSVSSMDKIREICQHQGSRSWPVNNFELKSVILPAEMNNSPNPLDFGKHLESKALEFCMESSAYKNGDELNDDKQDKYSSVHQFSSIISDPMILDDGNFPTKRHENNNDWTVMSNKKFLSDETKNKTTLVINKFPNKGNGLVKNSIARKRRSSRVIVRKSVLAAPKMNGRRSSGLHSAQKNNFFDSSKWRIFGIKKKPIETHHGHELQKSRQNVFKNSSKPCNAVTVGASQMPLTPSFPSKTRLNQLQKLFVSRMEMNKAATASKNNLNHGFPSNEVRGDIKNAISTKPKDLRYFEKTNAFVKCISGRRSSDINSVGTKLVPNQGISVHQEQFFYTPTKPLQHTKFRKEGLTKVGFMSVPSKQCHGEHNKKILLNENLKHPMGTSTKLTTSHSFLKCESPSESYDISDLKYDDEGATTPKIRKKIPDWATGHRLVESLMKFYMNPVKVEDIFGTILAPDLNDIFDERKPRFDKRTSSANWEEPLLRPSPEKQHRYC